MIKKHLSDEQIQQYLDDRDRNNGLDIEEHLKSCPDCQKNFDQYKGLYSSLQIDTVPKLSPNFAHNVVSSLPDITENKWEQYESGFVISLVLIGLAISFYFINPLPFLAETGNAVLSKLPSYGSDLLSKLNGNLPFVLIAIVIFFLVEVFDKKLLKPKV